MLLEHKWLLEEKLISLPWYSCYCIYMWGWHYDRLSPSWHSSRQLRTFFILFVGLFVKVVWRRPVEKSFVRGSSWSPSHSWDILWWPFTLPTKTSKSNISDDFLLRPTRADSSPSVGSPEPFTSRYVSLPASTRCQHCPFPGARALTDTDSLDKGVREKLFGNYYLEKCINC